MWMFLWYEKLSINWLIHRNRYGRNGGLRSDKEADAAGQGSAGRFTRDQVGTRFAVCRRACTPQIMFDFRGHDSTAWLAAPRNETDILTDAAKKDRRVHVLGKMATWRTIKCSYVEVMAAESPDEGKRN